MKLTVGAQIALMNHREKERDASRVAKAVEAWFETEVKTKVTPASVAAMDGRHLVVKGLSRFLRERGFKDSYSIWTLASPEHVGHKFYQTVVAPWLAENELAPVFDDCSDFVGLQTTVKAKVWLRDAYSRCGPSHPIWKFVEGFMHDEVALTDEAVARVNAAVAEQEAEQDG